MEVEKPKTEEKETEETKTVQKNQIEGGQQKVINSEQKELILVEGKLRKIIHQEGEGDKPQNGQEISALYKGTLQDGTQFDSNQDRESPFKFTIGKGQVIKGWDQGFASMKKGQKATLICSPDYAYGDKGSPPKIPPNSTLNFDVQLLDFKDKKKQKWELSSQQKISEATKSRDKGNNLMKDAKYSEAIQDYKDGIEYVDMEQNDQAKNILKILQLNISQAYLKVKQFQNAIDNCTKVLKDTPNNIKALYRRGVSYSKSQQFQLAETDLQAILKIQPNNIDAKKQLNQVMQSIKKFKAKQKKVFGGMFSQGNLYDDIKPEQKKDPIKQQNIPNETVKPEQTKKPEQTVEPEQTKKTEQTVKPEQTKKTEQTVKPEQTKKTEQTVKPEQTKKTEQTVKPEQTKKSEKVEEPSKTGES